MQSGNLKYKLLISILSKIMVKKTADANQDGYVEAADATAILKYNINKIDKTNDKVGTEK